MINVVHLQRRPQRGQFSIERVFTDIRQALPEGISCRVAVSRFPSRGLLRRFYNTVEAAVRQSDVNHVTGDVHFLTLLLQRRRAVLTILDCVSLERLRGVKRELFRFFWYTLPIRRARVITVISTSVKAELLRHTRCSAEKVEVIHCCVSSGFEPVPRPFNVDRPVVLQIGTGTNKNLLRVIAALEGVPCHLRIVGPLDEEQKAALGRAPQVYSVISDLSDEEMVDEYVRCDLVVFASTYEGFGMPIIEANATGRPVITSNVLSMPEIAGDAACLVDPFDSASIRAGLLRLIGDPEYRDDLIRKGYENARRFTPAVIAEQYAQVYRRLAAQQ